MHSLCRSTDTCKQGMVAFKAQGMLEKPPIIAAKKIAESKICHSRRRVGNGLQCGLCKHMIQTDAPCDIGSVCNSCTTKTALGFHLLCSLWTTLVKLSWITPYTECMAVCAKMESTQYSSYAQSTPEPSSPRVLGRILGIWVIKGLLWSPYTCTGKTSTLSEDSVSIHEIKP